VNGSTTFDKIIAMLKLLFVILAALSLISCSTRNNNPQLRSVMESLENSNKQLKENCIHLSSQSLRDVHDPATSNVVSRWHPKAVAITKMSDGLNSYLESLKEKLTKAAVHKNNNGEIVLDESNEDAVESIFEDQNEASLLEGKLAAFRENALQELLPSSADSILTNYIKKDIVHFRSSLPQGIRTAGTAASTQNYFSLNDYFKETNALNALLLLTKYQNDVLLTQHTLLDYLSSRTTRGGIIFDDYTRVSAIAMLTSGCVRPGENVEVIAGLGEFSAVSKPVITINGKLVPLNDDAVAEYKFKAGNEPGRHEVRVRFEYTDTYGSKQSIEKLMVYNISN
jgi:hypothetical protein